jgi:SAM-dependent methyltransferase
MTDALPHYTLGASDEEHRRLVHLARHEEDHVEEACRRAGVRAGATVVDAGCGPLGALPALSRIVGPAGRVIGVDGSDAALRKARHLLRDHAHVRFVHGDVNEITRDAIGEGEGVELVYSRLMLLHQADPEGAVRQLAGLLKPGGAFIAHEPSADACHAPASEPHVPAMTRVWKLVVAAARARGADTGFGRSGRSYLERAGLTVESHRAYVVHYPPEIGYDIPRIALHSLRPVLEAHALASADEIAALERELADAKTRSDAQWVSSPLMFEWIGRQR